MRIIILVSNSMSGNILFRDFIRKRHEMISAIIIADQLKGGVFKKIRALQKLSKKASFQFLLYKIVESAGYAMYVNFLNLFRANKIETLKVLAKKYDIKLIHSNNVNSENFVSRIKKMEPDYILCYTTQLLKRNFLDIPKKGCLNLHGSSLPDYKGAAQYIWYLINGDKEGGVSVHYMEENLDTGDILMQKKFPINNDSAYSLHRKMALEGGKIMDKVVEYALHGNLNRVKQRECRSSDYLRLPTKDDMRLFRKKSLRLIRPKEFFKVV